MAVSPTSPTLREELAGEVRPLLLRNSEIERFEKQYDPFGVFALFSQLVQETGEPQVRHVRDLVALGLIGGGMEDREADALVASLPPGQNVALKALARRLLVVTFLPDILTGSARGSRSAKKPDGSAKSGKTRRSNTTPPPASETSAE